MKRVLWLHQNYVSERHCGNIRASYLLRALSRSGWQIDVVSGTRTYLGDVVARAGAVEEVGGARVHRVGIPVRDGDLAGRAVSYASFAHRALAYSRKLPRPDLVFASSPPLPQIAPSALLAAFYGAPLVLEVRDLWPAFLIEGGLLRSRTLIAAMRGLEAFALRFAEYVVCASPGFVPALRAMGVPASRIQVAPTGVDSSLARAPWALRAEWRRAHGLDGRLVVLYAGSFNKAYGIPLLLAAADQSRRALPHASWLFAGNGRDRPAVEAAARDLENVRYLGSLSRSELVPALLSADVGVNAHADWPLLDATLTGKLFDYLAAGVPVVSLRDGVMGLLLAACGGGSVADEVSVPALLAEVRRWGMLTPEQRVRHAGRVRSWSMAHLDAERIAEGLVHRLDEIRASASSRGLRGAAKAVASGIASVAAGVPARATDTLRNAGCDGRQLAAFQAWARDFSLSAPPAAGPGR